MVKVKICGLRRKEDIEYANELKPDYVGFVFAKSKRQVEVEQALYLISLLDKEIKTVGVFVNEPVENALKIAQTLNLDVLQFHGDETQDYIDNFKNFTVWKAIRIKDKEDLEKTKEFRVNSFVFDTLTKNEYGGTGKTFNWEVLKGFELNVPIILAGGLNENNVEEAIRIVNPYAVDVSSGVETEGYKDFKKMKSFIEKVRGIR
ncbi:phosphoribosylanthranilate isomerase [Thermoanaerobacter thermohydrosulfuricus]|uniref:N-(5'-phosphoribosyl)anthranilate isomerase n=5 Tax=Thermoanaerobacter TaxID=1754 RepID=I8R0L9_9THEO|nr:MULTISPECIES: phosphoribosylanthranilate isomerase [Thermoanaerobacter]EGD52456.1 Phosphoribosylanthranilate isomerase [Thermoanaerobacter ethanolicus JW 200]AEM78935.1 N-(5'phosphoribosyl)anthranilate isomerase (PRAI) [Thermoanaerobacter wiegelii Rt8.B1]AIS52652.1 N-(5'-phosphoribosyl)anthranilate isomerase TrpF [Thermoanaerobacter kivui]EIW00973.1 phosphoribosylanthranilate isomerase [Thermoanaerobacter siderophilus SR4]EMT38768.1 Phosphoribosylanthranilate isomerase [Thermoanaerobacter t